MPDICYFHQNRIVHRKFRPKNILFFEAQKNVKSKWYPLLHSTKNSRASMIFYIILCDYLPFNDEAEKEITKEVKKGGFDFLEK